MIFSINLTTEPVQDLESSVEPCLGLIKIGSFQEYFQASLTYWNADDYRRHWKQAIERIIRTPNHSCLITSMLDPLIANFIFWWPMYRVDDTVFIQNHILFFDKLKSSFDESDPFIHIPERRTVDEDGEKISEWSVQMKDLESFLKEDLQI